MPWFVKLTQEESERKCPMGPALLFPVEGLKALGTTRAFPAVPTSGFHGQHGNQAPWASMTTTNVSVHLQEERLPSRCTQRWSGMPPKAGKGGCMLASKGCATSSVKGTPAVGKLRHQPTSRVPSKLKLLYSCGFRSWTLERMVVKLRL